MQLVLFVFEKYERNLDRNYLFCMHLYVCIICIKQYRYCKCDFSISVVPEGKEAALQKFKNITLKGGNSPMIEMNRMQNSTLLQLMRIYKDPSICLNNIPYISFDGEMAADVGGPTKEDVLTKVDVKTGIQLFIGDHGHMVPLCSMDEISSGCFHMVGKLIAHGVLHCGMGFSGLAPAFVKYITSGSVDEAQDLVTVSDVPDIELRVIIEKVM